jgi:pimeloyl-ACP methyl ester carboxylesterase
MPSKSPGNRCASVSPCRHVIVDFDVVVLPHTGHYPMLGCPKEFNRRLEEVVRGLVIAKS